MSDEIKSDKKARYILSQLKKSSDYWFIEYGGSAYGKHFNIHKEERDSNWYIQVSDIDSGIDDYDGWWLDSYCEPILSAIKEAVTGAMLFPELTKPKED